MKKFVLLLTMFFFALAASAQVPPPTGDGDDCPVGYFWDGIECCLVGQVCNPTPPGGGDPDPPNDPPEPTGDGDGPLPTFDICDWVPPGWFGCP